MRYVILLVPLLALFALADIGQGFATAADKSQRSIKVTVEV